MTGIVTRRAVHEPSTGALLLDASHRDLFGSQAVAGTFALQSLKLRNASYSARGAQLLKSEAGPTTRVVLGCAGFILNMP